MVLSPAAVPGDDLYPPSFRGAVEMDGDVPECHLCSLIYGGRVCGEGVLASRGTIIDR